MSVEKMDYLAQNIIRQRKNKIYPEEYFELVKETKTAFKHLPGLIYPTYENFGKGFTVHISDKNTAELYDPYSGELKLNISFINMILGFDPTHEVPELNIFFEIGENHYLYVGDHVFEFKTKEPGIAFLTESGDEQIVFPSIITNNYVYVLTEGSKWEIPRKELDECFFASIGKTRPERELKSFDDVYDYYNLDEFVMDDDDSYPRTSFAPWHLLIDLQDNKDKPKHPFQHASCSSLLEKRQKLEYKKIF